MMMMMRQSQTLKVQKPQPLLDIVVASLAICWLSLNCKADAEFIALFFLLLLITIMGELCQHKWINPKNATIHIAFVLKSYTKLAFHSTPPLVVLLLCSPD